MTARDRVAEFVRQWQRPSLGARRRTNGVIYSLHSDPAVAPIDLLIADLEALSKPRQVVRTLPQLQALPVGTIIAVQGTRAAQVDEAEAYDFDTGKELEAKRLVYVGTDLYDNLLPDPSKEERDTLRRMLPAIVIDPLD